jgi:tRNA (adenine37-N6)-methyltransferase
MSDTQQPGIVIRPIGVIHTPHQGQPGTPIQPVYAEGMRGTATLLEPYVDALADLDGFERVWLVYEFDRARPWQPRVVPYRDTTARGLFATRAPARPNPIGLSVVRLVSIDGPVLTFDGADMLDGTPLVDIKPYVPEFDAHPGSRAGWIDLLASARTRADGRFG